MLSGLTTLALVQNWICKNEIIDVESTKISKNHHVKKTSFQIQSNKFYSKNDNSLFVIEFRRKSEISMLKIIEKYQ